MPSKYEDPIVNPTLHVGGEALRFMLWGAIAVGLGIVGSAAWNEYADGDNTFSWKEFGSAVTKTSWTKPDNAIDSLVYTLAIGVPARAVASMVLGGGSKGGHH